MLSKSERDAIRARVDAATKGPWKFWDGGVMTEDSRRIHEPPEPHPPDSTDCQSCKDSEFISHARADIPALLDDLDAKDVQLAAYRKALERIRFELIIPAAEYVPAIPACVEIADSVLQSPDPGKALLDEHAAERKRIGAVLEAASLGRATAERRLTAVCAERDALRQRAEAAERKGAELEFVLHGMDQSK